MCTKGFDDLSKKFRGIGLYVVIVLALVLAASIFLLSQGGTTTKYSEIIGYFENNQVKEYTFDWSNNRVAIVLRDGRQLEPYTVPSATRFLDTIEPMVDEYNETASDEDRIVYDQKRATQIPWFVEILPYLLMGIAMMAFLYFMLNRMGGGTKSSMNFGKARIKSGVDEKRKTTFDDVAGADEEKEELKELVDFLKNPKKYSELGAKIPKGVLLVGPPGTGKTLLARAVAGEAGVPFYSISGSDFVEMFVGVGASRVRDLFDQAKKSAPSIIFIDEIDAVGRHRGAGLGGGHDEREQTLNQLLVEMDGFGANEGVIVIAATNRPDVLDPALLRPGRFDRQVHVGRPDIKGRVAVLKVHARGKPLGDDVSLENIAKVTVGFTGADLENLLNEAALLAARRNKRVINQAEMQEAMMKVIMGTEKQSRKITPRENKLTAYHEAGHAIVGHYLKTQDPIHEVSIIPRGGAGGYTLSLPKEDVYFKTRNEMFETICDLLGGRVAEKLVLGDISTGASNDIQRATQIARDMITKYGMSESLGPMTFGSGQEEVFLGRDFATSRNYSENIAAQIDEEMKTIIDAAYEKATQILTEHIQQLHDVANALLIREKITGDEFREILKGRKIMDIIAGESSEPKSIFDGSTSDEADPQDGGTDGGDGAPGALPGSATPDGDASGTPEAGQVLPEPKDDDTPKA